MSVFFTRRGKAAVRVNYVPWIESTGTQWLDTLVYLKSNSRIVIDAEILDTNTGTDHHIGSVYDGSVYNTIRLKSDRTAYQARYGTQALKAVAHSGALFGRHLFERNANSFTIDGGTATTFTAGTWTQTVTYPLFCYKGNNGGNSGYIKMRLYSCRIWTDDVLVCDIRPCYDPDGVACAHDSVAGEYRYNQGTGEFVVGNDDSGGEDANTVTLTVSGEVSSEYAYYKLGGTKKTETTTTTIKRTQTLSVYVGGTRASGPYINLNGKQVAEGNARTYTVDLTSCETVSIVFRSFYVGDYLCYGCDITTT